MLHKQIPLGTVIIIAIVLFHTISIVSLITFLKWLPSTAAFWGSHLGTIGLLGIAVFIVIVIHTIEAWVWAITYLMLGEFTELKKALYFSVVTCTALGYGDITLSERWQLLSTFEAMGGLLLFGASTAFLIGFMQSLFTF